MLSSRMKKMVWARFMSDASKKREIVELDKSELWKTISSIDEWITATQESFNLALPSPARVRLGNHQKLELYLLIVRKRFEGE